MALGNREAQAPMERLFSPRGAAPPVVLAVGAERFDRLMVGAAEAAAGRGWRWSRRLRRPRDLVGDPELAAADVLLIPGSDICDQAVFAGAPRLRAVVSSTIGVEGIDARAASDRGVIVCNTPIPENYEGVAEGTILLILASLYDLPGKMRLAATTWPDPQDFDARMLWRKTVGLVGFGRIAQAVARRLSGWDVRLLAHTRSDKPLPAHVERADLDILLAESDIVVLLTSLNDETRRLIDTRRLAMMKPDVVIVNTSRGGVADEAALYQFAKSNPSARLALDVFEVEPLSPDSPLRGLPNVILTPHVIAGTREVREAIHKAVVDNVTAILNGAPRNVCNPSILEAWTARWGVPPPPPHAQPRRTPDNPPIAAG
jgi:phosphoglycerate dehydrogenase-like enzyme